MGALGAAEDMPVVGELLDDTDPHVRRAAVVALLRIGSAAARPALARALGDDDCEVRVYAAEALNRLAADGPGRQP